jgi:hypothetical protein
MMLYNNIIIFFTTYKRAPLVGRMSRDVCRQQARRGTTDKHA